jgi:hypothetical protein
VTGPPPFPRIPLLLQGGEGDSDDLRLSPAALRAWFGPPLVVEEKLDGANVSIWRDAGGGLCAAGRGGPDALDRAGQIGRLRAWVSARTVELTALLDPEAVLYGEWLYLQHSVGYDQLPDLLCVLDLWTPTGGFSPPDARDRRCAAHGLWSAPVVHRGPVTGPDDLLRISARSRFREGPMEGVVLRRAAGTAATDRAKWIRPGFCRLSDADWQRGRPKNGVRR